MSILRCCAGARKQDLLYCAWSCTHANGSISKYNSRNTYFLVEKLLWTSFAPGSAFWDLPTGRRPATLAPSQRYCLKSS